MIGSKLSYYARPKAILDQIGSITAALSLRRVSGYWNPCIRVRRSSDNATQDINFLNGVLDTASLLSFCGSSSGFVTIWYDESGKAFHFIQNTATDQPRIVNSGTLETVDGKPAILFNSPWRLARNLTVNTAAFTVNSVFKQTVSNGNYGYAMFAETVLGFGYQNNNFAAFYGDGVGSWGSTSPNTPLTNTLNNKSTYTSVKSGTTNSTFVNTVALTPRVENNYNSNTSFTLGVNPSNLGMDLKGYIMEMVIFSKALTSTERLLLENNQKTFYGIA